MLFLTPLLTQMFSDQHNPLDEGKEAEGMVAAWLGGCLGLEQSNVSRISRSSNS